MSTVIASQASHPAWKSLKLKYLARFQAGDHITAETIRTDGDFPVYGGNGLRGFTDAYSHEGEFVLVGRQGALCGNVNYASGRIWASEHAVVVSPAPGTDVRWLGELLRSMDLRQYSMTAAQPGLSVEFVVNLSASVPPLKTQRQIAAYLDRETARIDALIGAKERLLALLAEKRQALITHVVTRGLNPDTPLRDSGVPWLGAIPEHWEVKRLRFLAEVRTGLTIGKDYGSKTLQDYFYLRVANVQDGYLALDELTTVAVPEDEARSSMLQPGDVLMNEGGDIDKLGRGCVWRGEVSPCLHQNHVFCVRPHSVNPDWLTLWTATQPAKSYFENRAKRTTNLASISSTNIYELPVPLPPTDEQEAIKRHIEVSRDRLDAIASTTQSTVNLLRERRSALIVAVVTGQLEVED